MHDSAHKRGCVAGECLVLAVDTDWLKVRITSKKGVDTTKLIRTEDLAEVTCL